MQKQTNVKWATMTQKTTFPKETSLSKQNQTMIKKLEDWKKQLR